MGGSSVPAPLNYLKTSFISLENPKKSLVFQCHEWQLFEKMYAAWKFRLICITLIPSLGSCWWTSDDGELSNLRPNNISGLAEAYYKWTGSYV